MKNFMLAFRHVSLVAVFSTLAGSVLMFGLGCYKAVMAFLTPITALDASIDKSDLITTSLIKSLDAFLIAFVLFIFAYGTYGLFISETDDSDTESDNSLGWINITSIGHLKNKLAEVIIVILFVKFLEVALLNMENMRWELLVLPLATLMLAASLKLMELKK